MTFLFRSKLDRYRCMTIHCAFGAFEAFVQGEAVSTTCICVRRIADCRSFKIGCNITVSRKFKALGMLHKVMHLIPRCLG